MKLTISKCVNSNPKGSALIMVVVLTVLLAAIGVLFVMATRVDEMASTATVTNHQLDIAVDSVVELISKKLAQDLTDDITASTQVAFDYPGIDDDVWLSNIEPRLLGSNPTPATYGADDIFSWRRISDLELISDPKIQGGYLLSHYLPFGIDAWPYLPTDANDIPHVPGWNLSIANALLVTADADGDGVTDSVWQRLPDTTGTRGEPIFAAVRIIDNCGMLNLNTAHGVYTSDPNLSEGRYLSQVDYKRFLRGSDRNMIAPPLDLSDPDSIIMARQDPGFAIDETRYHEDAIMKIENPGRLYSLFDISDELEIRNRFMLTSLYEARFERKDTANYTFDPDGGIYSVLQVPIPHTNEIAGYFDDPGTVFPYRHFEKWKWRLDPNNFDDTSGAYVDSANPKINYQWKYDRRHISTFYSFDRNLRLGVYPRIYDDNGDELYMIFRPDPSAVSTNIRQLLWDTVNLQYYYSYNNPQTRLQILKLLYAFRAYFIEKDGADYKDAARKAAQFVANMIDYVDDTNPDITSPNVGPFVDAAYGSQTNDNPTYIDRDIINQLIYEASGDTIDVDVNTQYDFGLGVDEPEETVYGYERQPFISEIVRYQDAGVGSIYAIELVNPYEKDISLFNWRLRVGTYEHIFPDAIVVPAATVGATRQLGRLIVTSHDALLISNDYLLPGPGETGIVSDSVVMLQRPDPKDTADQPTMFITVDLTESAQATFLNGPGLSDGEYRSSRRDDKAWKFANMASPEDDDTNNHRLNMDNNVDLDPNSWQMPVADDNQPIGTLLDFERVLLIGNFKDPNELTEDVTNTVTQQIGDDEGMIRNVVPMEPGEISPVDYVCFMGRPEGNLPGRININTATKEVIRAAFPPNITWNPSPDKLIENIITRRDRGIGSQISKITELLKSDFPGFTQFSDDPDNNGVGDPDMFDDFEERDWILSTVANVLTVRSDVFTAYILVRLGHNGPQRRMIAIFDRSNVDPWDKKADKPRIIALHPVPDPR